MGDVVTGQLPAEHPRKIYSDRNRSRKVYTVSQVNRIAKETLENLNVWVEGEISRCDKHPQYSFFYLTLKDETAVLPCLADKFVLDSLEGELVGQKVVVYGFLTVYEPRGQYQLRIEFAEPAGEGLMRRKLEETIRRLRTEGLFEAKYKKEIPQYPRRVCVVTSAGSDAWNDFRRHTVEKFPIIELYVADVRVQGPQSAPQLLKILPKLDKMNSDVLVITRGGGSLEDLVAFNDENIARTIFAMKTPTVVAIGHETNESLAELVADKRASTPTDAAHIITAGYSQASERIFSLSKQLKLKYDYFFSTNFQKLDHFYFQLQQGKVSFANLPHRLKSLVEALRRHEKYLIQDASRKVMDLGKLIEMGAKKIIDYQNQRLSELQIALSLLSPDNVLARGYAIATDERGKVLKSVETVRIGSILAVRLSDGKLTSVVKSKEKNAQRYS